MRREYRRLTLEDISKEINISRTTIYKVVNNKGTVSPKTREIVLKALKKYDYVPNNNARNLALHKEYTIAVIDYVSADAAYFSPSITEGIGLALKTYKDHGLQIERFTCAHDNPEEQVSDIREAFEAGIRDFIIVALDIKRISAILIDLKKSDCNIVLLSKRIDSQYYDAFIGVDDFKCGALAGELFCKMLPSGGNVLVTIAEDFYSDSSATQARLNGFKSQVEKNTQIKLLPVATHIRNNDDIVRTVSDAINDVPLSGIFDLSYRLDTICKTLKEMERAELTLIGVDLFPEIISYINDSTISAIVFQNLEEQTLLACKLLFENRCYGKQIVNRKFYSKLEVVMKQNLEYFV